jgi:4-diphosphocytidyl-2-C-methyl-D-erythritol kinase
MEKSVRARAPAKVNLHLRVYGRRADGFHGLRSIFQAISLADDIVVRSLKQPERIEIDGVFDCPPEKTTFYKAIVAFRDATGRREGISISVRKAIPAGGGLGGGSSDAASAIMALDALFETKLAVETMADIGKAVGSDVPFFLHGGAALVKGRGEIVEPIPARDDFAMLLVYPGFPVSTPEAYRLLDILRPDDSLEADPSDEELRSAYERPPLFWPFVNSFEAPLSQGLPEIGSWISRLKVAGAPFSRMSGSGSTLFGVFDDEDRALAAARSLGKAGFGQIGIVPVRPLACAPCLL